MRGIVRPPVVASCFAMAFFALASTPAPAWEWVYGPPGSVDDASRRVTPVPACGMWGPGYIAVGTHDAASPDPDVYVVFTDAFGGGAPGWEATYDVEGLTLPDEGMAIVPVPGGYVFLSNSWNGSWSPALTFIDCDGNWGGWSEVYPATIVGYDLRGNDLIRTQTGDPMFMTAPGDLVVAGVSWNGGNEDAFLMRTDAGGNPIWNVAHNTNFPEAFHALTEALPWGTALTGDLVAVGRWNDYMGNQDGLVARVDGNTGMIGALPQCLQHHGAVGTAEVYNSVTRLQVNFPGQFALVGTTTSTVWMDDIWVTRGNSCALTAQFRLGNPGGMITAERGNDIIEVLVAKPGAPVGSLAIAGDHGPAFGGPYDAALTLTNPVFAPLPAQGRLFGVAAQQETFSSLAENPPGWPILPQGYILAGAKQGPGTDPLDLYLVHDDPAAVVCERPWNPLRVLTSYPQTTLPSAPVAVATRLPNWPLFAPLMSGLQICSP